jgi:hypothetical protein
LNLGYIEHWAAQNMGRWDTSVERRAGGFDDAMAMDSQEFCMTNLSSLYALVASVVRDYYHGKLATTSEITRAAKSIRILLFMNCSAGDIEMLNSTENIEQHERKRHGELDNIAAVQEWMSSMRSQHCSLDPSKAVDVFKFACTLRSSGNSPDGHYMHAPPARVECRNSHRRIPRLVRDPRQKQPPWLKELLGDTAETPETKTKAIASPEISLNWLKATIESSMQSM